MANSLRGKLGTGWTEAELKILISNARRAVREERFGRDIYDKMVQRKIAKGDLMATISRRSHIGNYLHREEEKTVGFANKKINLFVAYRNDKIQTTFRPKGCVIKYLQKQREYKMIWKPEN